MPETERQVRIRAFAGRRVTIRKQADGVATLVAQLAEIDAYRIHRRLNSIATALQAEAVCDGQPEPRTCDQLGADVLNDLLLGRAGTRADLRTPDEGNRGLQTRPNSRSSTSVGPTPARCRLTRR